MNKIIMLVVILLFSCSCSKTVNILSTEFDEEIDRIVVNEIKNKDKILFESIIQ